MKNNKLIITLCGLVLIYGCGNNLRSGDKVAKIVDEKYEILYLFPERNIAAVEPDKISSEKVDTANSSVTSQNTVTQPDLSVKKDIKITCSCNNAADKECQMKCITDVEKSTAVLPDKAKIDDNAVMTKEDVVPVVNAQEHAPAVKQDVTPQMPVVPAVPSTVVSDKAKIDDNAAMPKEDVVLAPAVNTKEHAPAVKQDVTPQMLVVPVVPSVVVSDKAKIDDNAAMPKEDVVLAPAVNTQEHAPAVKQDVKPQMPATQAPAIVPAVKSEVAPAPIVSTDKKEKRKKITFISG